MKKILIPVDYSEYSERAVEEGVKMAKAFGSQVFLLHVNNTRINYSRYDINMPLESIEASIEEEILRAEEMLEKFKKSFGAVAGNVKTEILQGDTIGEIVEYAKKIDPDLIIIGSHGMGTVLRRTILGSIASKVLHNIEKPVLIVK